MQKFARSRIQLPKGGQKSASHFWKPAVARSYMKSSKMGRSRQKEWSKSRSVVLDGLISSDIQWFASLDNHGFEYRQTTFADKPSAHSTIFVEDDGSR